MSLNQLSLCIRPKFSNIENPLNACYFLKTNYSHSNALNLQISFFSFNIYNFRLNGSLNDIIFMFET